MTLRIGALFAGYGGLDMAVMDTLDAELAWYAEWDKAPAKVMEHHHPGVPNLWDVTKVDWASLEPVDIITGGSPCQDLSHAGKRAGMKAGTRSGLWASMCDAIDTIRPRLVVWENVRGALNAEAASELELCPGCMGGGDDGAVLRALGRVLGDLADIGYDARWYGLRAADVGGAHSRFRVFVIAAPAGRPAHLTPLPGSSHPPVPHGLALLPTPRAAQGETRNSTIYRRMYLGEEVTNNLENAVAQFMSPEHGAPKWSGLRGAEAPAAPAVPDGGPRWLHYDPAIRWAESVTGRAVPEPAELGPTGRPRLSPAFVEWLMMLPAGHVTNPVIGLDYGGQMKALGNGVVPPQASAAIRAYLRDEQEDPA